MSDLLHNPGSYNDFVREHNLQLGLSALFQYSAELAQHRQEIADAQGISLDELHTAPLPAPTIIESLGHTAVA